MLRTILVPLDGSALAERALATAGSLAETTDARLILLNVIWPLGIETTGNHASTEEERVALGKEYLAHLVAKEGLEPATQGLVIVGDPTRVVLDTIGTQHADLVVMSSHGRSGLGRWLYGGVADAVMRRATVPVIILPPRVQVTESRELPPRILVPLDGSDLALRAIPPAEELAVDLDGELLLLRVVLPDVLASLDPDRWGMVDPTVIQAAAEAELALVAASLRSRGRAVQTLVAFGLPIATISEVASERDVQIIALSTHGRGGVNRLVLGSVAGGLVRYADRPILVIGPETAISSAFEAEEIRSLRTDAVKVTTEGVGLEASRQALADGPIDARIAAARALGRAGGEDAAEALAQALRAAPSSLRHPLVRALIQVGPDATPRLLGLLGDPAAAVRARAAEALAQIADPRSASELVVALEDVDPGIRWSAGRGLARMGKPGLVTLLHGLMTRPLSSWLAQGTARVLRHSTWPSPKPISLQRLSEALTHSTASVEAPVRAAEALEELKAPHSRS